jgi:superfamily II DNA or RNA helicase
MDRTERQKEAIRKWQRARCLGTLVLATGFGKTFTTMMAIKALITKNPKLSVLVSVPTDFLRDQWHDQIIKNNLIEHMHVEVINTIIKNTYDVDLLVVDEVHGTPGDCFQRIFTCVKYKMILCLTGTLERLDGREKLIKHYAPVVDTVTVEEAVENGWLSQYREYKVLLDVDMTEYNQWHAEFLKYFAIFDFDFNRAMSCSVGPTSYIHRLEYAKKLVVAAKNAGDYKQKLMDVNKEVTAAAYSWNRAMRKRKEFVTKHPKKIEVARKILEARPDAKAITFSATMKMAEEIGIGYVLHSGQTKKKRGITSEEFKKCKSGVINTAKALDAGADFPDLNLGIILSGSSSSIQKKQRSGRIIRYQPGKIAEIFTLVIRGTNEEKWYNEAIKGTSYITIDEQELDIVLSQGSIDTRQRDDSGNLYMG